jgi:glycine cleavage system H protein
LPGGFFMKDISEMNFPENLRYSKDHEWTVMEGDTVKIGISDYAQAKLGDIVFVELPEVGDRFSKSDEFGTVESVKAVSSLYMPLGGEIVAVNDALEDTPEAINESCYDKGWIITVKPNDAAELNGLMTSADYLKQLKED